jgi:hypothetical protein
MLTRADESDLIEDIKDGIGIALSWRGASAESIDSIKLNKLAYLAITRLDVPVTFGWYKYGPAPVDLQYSEAAVTARAEENCDAPGESRLPQRDYYSPLEYAYFFDQELEEFDRILQAPTKEFLVSFYEREAPKLYKQLYVKSAQTQQILDEIQEDSSWHEDAETYHREITRSAGELTRELMQIESLREARKPFRLYVRFLKKLLAHASAVETLSPRQQRFIKRIIDYYYASAWKYVALMISEDTVHFSPGENQDALLTSIENEKQEIRSSYENDLTAFADRGRALGIIDERENGESRNSQENQTFDRKRAESWTKASAEAIGESSRDEETTSGDGGVELDR